MTIFAKSSILDLWKDSEFASEASNDLQQKLHLRCFTEFYIRLCSHYLFSQNCWLFVY